VLGRLSVLASLLVAGGCAGAPARSAQPQQAPPQQALPLPDLALETLAGAPTRLVELIARRPSLVSLWATWCEPCVAEQPALGRLAKKAAEQGAFVVAVSEGESRATVAAFARTHALTFPQLIDEHHRLGDTLGQRSVPATLVIDREGRIIFRGAALDELALQALDAAIAAR